MTGFDWIIVAILILSTLMAVAQGLLREIFSLAGLILGLWLALWNYRVLAVPFERYIQSESVADIVAFLLIALGVMLIFSLIGHVVSALVRTVGLGGLDRLLGAVFGLVRGGVLVLLMILVVAAFLPQSGWMSGSKLAPYFLSAAHWSSSGAPADLRVKIRQGVADMERVPPSWMRFGLHPPPTSR
jgi:membrane protein required for colicin V production